MRLSWKLFFITTPIFVLFLTIFGIWIIQDSFDHSLSQAVEQCMAENQTFQNSYELTNHALSEAQWNQTTIKKVVASIKAGRPETEMRAFTIVTGAFFTRIMHWR